MIESSMNIMELTAREKRILYFLSYGNSNERIAAELGLSTATVQREIENMRHKLSTNNRVETVAVAIRLGIIT